MKRILLLFMALLVGACQAPSSYPVDSPFYQPPSGARLVLNRAIDIPPDSTSLRFQFGQVARGINEFETNCVFQLKTLRETSQRVEPDNFEITKVRSGSSFRNSARESWPGLIKVGLVSDDGDGGLPRYFFKTEMFLRSDRQPNVLMMTCQHAWEAGSSSLQYERPPTVAEMKAAWGEFFTLRLP